MGDGSKVFITGDMTQVDLPKPLVMKIEQAYENHEKS